jgi:formate/nitrite transporter FocA (FNT family)
MSTPSDEMAGTQRNYEDILRLQIEEGLGELERPASGQFLSALACGLNLALGVFSMFIMATQAAPVFSDFVTQLLKGIVYTFGFVFVIIAQTELFTEHTSLALIPVLDGRSSLGKLGQLWSLVYIGNLLGSGLFAVLGFYAGLSLHLVDLHAFVDVAMTFIDLSPMAVFLGAILAGWLMALLAWILTSVRDTISRIAVIIIVTFLIGFGHLPHCVAASAELVAGMLAGAPISLLEFVRFEAITTIGNIVGGVVFVGLLNYSFAVRGTDDMDVEV